MLPRPRRVLLKFVVPERRSRYLEKLGYRRCYLVAPTSSRPYLRGVTIYIQDIYTAEFDGESHVTMRRKESGVVCERNI